MNTLSMAQVAPAVNTPASAKPLRAASGFQAGFEAFCRGAGLDELRDPAEIRGWWAALDAAADCETAGYLNGGGHK